MKFKNITAFLLTLFLAINLSAQNKKEVNLTIRVKDGNGKPIPGAVILFDDVKQNRIANKKGVFKAKVKKWPKQISAFSAINGIAKINYKGQNKLDIVIRDKKDFYVVNDKKTKSLNPIQFRNIYDYMRGQVPGVRIGPDNRITIRGFNSVNGSTTPLFILNDAVVDQDIFGNVVPTNIKSIEVLKGPETSRYGLQGANGVIIVKTL